MRQMCFIKFYYVFTGYKSVYLYIALKNRIIKYLKLLI